MLTKEEKSEIAKMIRLAKNPKAQIEICKQLYCCSRKEVVDCIPGGEQAVAEFPSNRKDPYTREQKYSYCMRYSRGEWEEVMRELRINEKSVLVKKINKWKGSFPGTVWPKPPLDPRMIRMCREWWSGASTYELAIRMGTSRCSCRDRLKSFVRNHPEVVADLEDNRRRKRK